MTILYIFLVLSLSALYNSQQSAGPGDTDNRCREGTLPVGRQERQVVNDRPIIGVLSQEPNNNVPVPTNSSQFNYTSYIAASYVQSIEASGARIIPILIGKNRSYYETLMRKINGVLFPGGDVPLQKSAQDGYADAGQHIYEIALQINDEGGYFPIHGTCLGFQYLVILASGRGEEDNESNCSSRSNQPLIFNCDYQNSKTFSDAPQDIVNILETKNVTVNCHHFCILDENIEKHNLTKDWQITSYGYDDNGMKFISSIENKRYPFYGVQFHPEKPSFEWKHSYFYTHSVDAIKANRYFIDFFVQECRKNSHTFDNVEEENQHLICNYKSVFTEPLGGYFYETYFF